LFYGSMHGILENCDLVQPEANFQDF
jgi:hypothetical protein